MRDALRRFLEQIVTVTVTGRKVEILMDDDDVLLSVLVALVLLWLGISGDSAGSVYAPAPAPAPGGDGGGGVIPDLPGVIPSTNPSPSTPEPVPASPGVGGGDQIDLSDYAVVGGSPDVRSWPITTSLSIVSLEPAITPAFPDPGWPDVVPPGFEGPIQYTVWAVVPALRVMVGIIEMWRGRENCGNNDAGNVRYQLAQNWWYYVPELAGYLPSPGEQIGFLVTPGDARMGKGPFPLAQRSNVVVVTV